MRAPSLEAALELLRRADAALQEGRRQGGLQGVGISCPGPSPAGPGCR
jgi:hypothetical protein